MNPATWDAASLDPEETEDGQRPAPTLVSLHFLRSAVRRRRSWCFGAAVLGLVAAVAFLIVVPAPSSAKAVLVLSHDAQADPTRAMATDVSLLSTRTVAENALAELRLPIKPADLISTVTVVPATSDVLVLTLTAPSDAEAVRRLKALTSAYLRFRAIQLSAQSDVLVNGSNLRITALNTQIADLTKRIDLLGADGSTGTSQLSDAISQRAQLTAQVGALQQTVQETTLRTNSIVSTSRVIDLPAAEPSGAKRRAVLVVVSGLIGGIALVLALVLFRAITSDRLWRRVEVAAALETRVPISVGRLAPVPRPLRLPLPGARAITAHRAADRQRLAQNIITALPLTGGDQRVVVACVGSAAEVCFGVVTAATALREQGRSVELVDLTEDGHLDSAAVALAGGPPQPGLGVLRPRVIPSLAKGPADLDRVRPGGGPSDHASDDDAAAAAGNGTGTTSTGGSEPGTALVSLVVSDLNPAVGADHLRAWTHRVLLAVTAGRSSAEAVRTAGDQVRAAGLDLHCAVLLRADATDESSGSFDRPIGGS